MGTCRSTEKFITRRIRRRRVPSREVRIAPGTACQGRCAPTLTGLALMALLPLPATAGGAEEATTSRHPARVEVEYLYPVEEGRDIRTVNMNAYYPVGTAKALPLDVYAGWTVTRAVGDITQLEGDINSGTLRAVSYRSSGTGIGPAFLALWPVGSKGRWALEMEGSAAILLYHRDFPAGGDRYNFMWRAGPSLRFSIAKDRKVGVGYRWMHVSNGQGVGPQNPSYDARGISMRIEAAF